MLNNIKWKLKFYKRELAGYRYLYLTPALVIEDNLWWKNDYKDLQLSFTYKKKVILSVYWLYWVAKLEMRLIT